MLICTKLTIYKFAEVTSCSFPYCVVREAQKTTTIKHSFTSSWSCINGLNIFEKIVGHYFSLKSLFWNTQTFYNLLSFCYRASSWVPVLSVLVLVSVCRLTLPGLMKLYLLWTLVGPSGFCHFFCHTQAQPCLVLYIFTRILFSLESIVLGSSLAVFGIFLAPWPPGLSPHSGLIYYFPLCFSLTKNYNAKMTGKLHQS